MEVPLKEVIPPDFPVHSSSVPSLPDEGGFISHRPMSVGIDTITQGFRFAASGRKPSVSAGAGAQENGRGACRERTGSNNTVTSKISDSNSSIGRLDTMAALKVSVPIFTSAPLSLSHNTAPLPLSSPRGPAIHKEILPPSLPSCSSMRGRSNAIAKEKRKRVLSPSSLGIDPGNRDRSDHGGMLLQTNNGGYGRLEGSGEAFRSGGRREMLPEQRTPSDRRGFSKRKERPIKPPRPQNSLTTTPLQSRSRATEIIVLDDDIKVELVEASDSSSAMQRGNPSDGHDMGIAEPVLDSEQYLLHERSRVHKNQPAQHRPLHSKDNSRHIEARPDALNINAKSPSFYSGAGVVRTHSQSNTSHRSSTGNNEVLKKRKHGNISHSIGNPLQQTKLSSALSSPIITILNEEQKQSGSGEHKLLIALTTLTNEKQSLESELHEVVASAKMQVFRTEILEKKNTELETQVKVYKDTVSGLKKKILGIQKFVDGLGKDYNMLNEKKIQLGNRLNELSQERSEFLRNLKEVRSLVEKVDGTVQGWRSSGAILKEAYTEIEKLNGTLKFLHKQLSENAGLLAVERDRTQSLECQIQDDRGINRSILTAIHDGKAEILGRLTETRESIEEKGESCLIEKLTGAQRSIEAKIEVDGEVTRSSVNGYLKSLETLSDRGVDAAKECLLDVEKRVNHTSDSILGLFHETHKMNAEALMFTDSYINNLGSRIMDLEEELKEMREKYEISLVTTAEKEQLRKGLELKLEVALKRGNELRSQVEGRDSVENALNESISLLEKKLSLLEDLPIEDPSVIEATSKIKQRNYDLEKECELTRNNFQDASLSLQLKTIDLEKSKVELEALATKYSKAEEMVEGFARERAEFMAHAEEQKMKERIEVETNANMLRQRETSRLNNQIKALEAQKRKLEADNREFKAVAAGRTEVELSLRKEILQLNKKYADIEISHLELLQEKTRLENIVNNLTELGTKASTSYLTLQNLAETTAYELSAALKRITILQGEKDLMSQEIHAKEQELVHAKSEKPELSAVTEDVSVLQAAGKGLGVALKGSEKEKTLMVSEEDAIHAFKNLEEKTNALETLELLRGAEKGSNTVSNLYEEQELLKNEIERYENEMGGAAKNSDRIPHGSQGSFEIERSPRTLNTKEEMVGISCMAAESSAAPWENSPSFSPLTPLERIFETQIENEIWSNSPKIDNNNSKRHLPRHDSTTITRDLEENDLSLSRAGDYIGQLSGFPIDSKSRIKGAKKDSQGSQLRKNLATKFAPQRRPPSTLMYNDFDEATIIEDFSDNASAGTGASLPQNTYLEKTDPTPFTLRPRVIEEKYKDGQRLDITENTPVERYSSNPTTSLNKSKIPPRNNGPRVEPMGDDKKPQYRSRKERAKKTRDDQELVEDGGESPRNNKAKGETSNKNLRSYKERKKGGKRFL